ncbi:glutamate racemase [Modicisalibacter radicis]|uniref:glutamate racemase n=1 Tax=Halomonas sp. EAR18 TaxID=2518972 RepID=UPI00109C0433|nr:glutamate racemase [Halomonas sp. EAR18]
MPGPILIFDSGVGGLSVTAALRARLPAATLAYVCDNAMLPYGTKSDDWLVSRIVETCVSAVGASGAAVLVVACNTASTLALRELRARLEIPVVGTVPAIKPAAQLSVSRVIGLLATSATVNRAYTQTLIADFAADCRIVRVAADGLVGEAERQLAGLAPDDGALEAALAPLWIDAALDTVVLGCTHFPLLRRRLEASAPRAINWVDSGEAIARRVASVLDGSGYVRGREGRAWASAPGPVLAATLAGYGFTALEALSLSDETHIPSR